MTLPFADLLVVDDEPDIRELVAGLLSDEGFEVRTAYDGPGAIEQLKRRQPSLVLLDIWLEGSRLDGMETLSEIRSLYPKLPIIMISGHGNIDTAVRSIREGAYDYIEKPFKSDRLLHAVNRALETQTLKNRLDELPSHSTEILTGASAAMQGLRATIAKVAPTNSRVMLLGPEGVQSEAIARSLHAQSPRARGPFICVNLKAEAKNGNLYLFGREASAEKSFVSGAWERAHRGTLFIDSLEAMTRQTQEKLLGALHRNQTRRLDGDQAITSDVRLVTAAGPSLHKRLEQERFSVDLFRRLAVVLIDIPSLRDAISDLPAFVETYAHQVSSQQGIAALSFAPDALAVLQTYDWPGNFVQLRNAVERILIEAGDERTTITARDLPAMIGARLPKLPSQHEGERLLEMSLREARTTFEKSYLKAQMARFNANVAAVARQAGMDRASLHRKLKGYGLGR